MRGTVTGPRPTGHLVAKHPDLGWCLHPDAHLPASHAEHAHDDTVADTDGLAGLSGENEHGAGMGGSRGEAARPRGCGRTVEVGHRQAPPQP